MIIGIDLYGTITGVDFYNNPNMRLPRWLFYLKPNKAVIEKMQMMKTRGDQFMVVTSASSQFSWFSKGLLVFHHVPFDNLFCVGEGKKANERKLKIIREKKIEIFIDNNRRTIEFMRKNLVSAVNTSEFFN